MEFKEHLRKYLKEEEIESLLNSLVESRTAALLLNTEKLSPLKLQKMFQSIVKHPFIENCFIYNPLIDAPGKSIEHELGCFYLLEPCSALVAHYLAPTEDDQVLDLCAAPGGKTIHASLLMKNKGIIISNEVSSSRANILSYNIERLGRKNVVVINDEIVKLQKLYLESFDKIILDAPCSGSGMFRKDQKMKEDWSFNKVLHLQNIQKELILCAYQMLKPGGKMVYSTCSYSYEEDEEVVKYLLEHSDAKLLMIPQDDNYFRSDLKETIHLFPHRIKGEGHFIALIEKPGVINKNNDKKEKLFALPFKCERLKDDYIYAHGKDYYALSRFFDTRSLHVLRGGLKIGANEKYGFVYDHALSHYLNTFVYQISLTREELIQYYEGQEIKRADLSQDGYALLLYEGIGVDFAKIVKGRIKNYLPKGLRKKF